MPEPPVARLFAEHHAALYRYLTRLTGDPDAAADAAQEAFVRLLTRSLPPPIPGAPGRTAAGPDGETGGHSAERAWLYRVATNVALEQARTATRRRRLLAAAPGRAPLADPPPAPDAALEAGERRARVAAALAVLPERDRAALLLREAGFAHREIGEAVGTTTGAVGTVIARALVKLAAALPADAGAP